MRYSAVEKTLWLDPVIRREDFRVFIAADSGWGTVSLRKAPYGDVVTVEVIEGELEIERLVLGGKAIDLPGEQPEAGGSLEVRV